MVTQQKIGLTSSDLAQIEDIFTSRSSDLLIDPLVSLLRRRIENKEAEGDFDYEGRLRLALHFKESKDFHSVYTLFKPLFENLDGVHDTAVHEVLQLFGDTSCSHAETFFQIDEHKRAAELFRDAFQDARTSRDNALDDL